MRDYEKIKSIVYGKLIDKTEDRDYAELSEELFGEGNCFNSSEVRKRMYGMKRLIEAIESDNLDKLNDSELEKINEKIRELKIERNKLNVEKTENNKLLRDYSRVEMRFEQVEESIRNLKQFDIPFNLNHSHYIENFNLLNNKKHGVLAITDQHYGKNVFVRGLKGEIINEYNEDIFEKRMWDLLKEVAHIVNKEDLKVVHTLLLGDAVEGMLRNSTLMQLQNGLIDQTMKYAEFMATWLNELSKFCIVDLHYTLGNHSECRVLNSKSGDFPQENMERIIMFYLKTRLKENPNVVFNDTVAGFVYLNCLGVNILGSHGKEKNLALALREYSSIYKEDVNIFITGHLHHNSSTEIGIDTEVVRVRSLCGVDEYAMGLRKASNSGTSMMIIEEGKGKTITYDIKVK